MTQRNDGGALKGTCGGSITGSMPNCWWRSELRSNTLLIESPPGRDEVASEGAGLAEEGRQGLEEGVPVPVAAVGGTDGEDGGDGGKVSRLGEDCDGCATLVDIGHSSCSKSISGRCFLNSTRPAKSAK